MSDETSMSNDMCLVDGRWVPGTGTVRSESVLLREPIGVVVAITPYNYPINMISWKVGPALAAGCSVVLLPSPRGALCSVALLRLAEEAGVPPGVLNLVPGGPRVGARPSTSPARCTGTITAAPCGC